MKFLFAIGFFIFAPWCLADVSFWQGIPMVTSSNKSVTSPGGEGAQQIQAMAIGTDGLTMLMLTDVGGVYVSWDGGATWFPSNVGFLACGGGSCAIDPNNNNIMIATGGNSSSTALAGIYRSTDRGLTWSNVLLKTSVGIDIYRNTLAFDPSTSNGSASTVVYWISESDIASPGLYKSTDNGATWSLKNASFNTGQVKCAPISPGGSGRLYMITAAGFWFSTNGGTSFTEAVTNATMTGLDVTNAAVSNVYFCEGNTGVFSSTTLGVAASFSKLTGTGLVTTGTPGLMNICVSPSSAASMIVNQVTDSGTNQPYFSNNSGVNWTASIVDSSKSFLPMNQRQGTFLYSPTVANKVWTNTAGDAIHSSSNNGQTFVFDNNGYIAFTCQSIVNFSPFTPNNFISPSQDYNSGWTQDGGNTWTYQNVSGQAFGGFNFAGIALTTSIGFIGNTDAPGDTVTMRRSLNGGVTWGAMATSITMPATGAFYNVTCPDPNSSTVCFWNKWRISSSGTAAATLASGVQGVFCFDWNGTTHTIYGASTSVIWSSTNGTSWSRAATAASNVLDLAHDWQNNIYYAACSTGEFDRISGGVRTNISSRIPSDQQGTPNIYTVCTDPFRPNIVYAGGYPGGYTERVSVCVSYDAGKTFRTITKQSGDAGMDGGIGPVCLRVHPATRDLWAFGGVYGMSKYPVPVWSR